MPVTQAEIDAAQDAADALKNQQINESEAPVSKKLVDDVMNGVVSLKPPDPGQGIVGEPAVDCTNMKAKGITTGLDVVDGKWATVILPTDTATGDAKALLFAQHAVLTSEKMGGQRIDLNGDAGPIEVRIHHAKLARWIYDSEKTFA